MKVKIGQYLLISITKLRFQHIKYININIMATQTDTTTAIQGTAARLLADQSVGDFKSRIPTSYDKDAEAGLKGYPAAKVSNPNIY